MKKIFIFNLLFLFSFNAFAQYDSTNLPGLSTSYQTPNNTSSGSGVPDPAALSPSTSYTETMVQACPSSGGNGYGYYPNGPVPADGTNVAGQTVTGGVVYDQTVTTNRFGTTTYSGWYQVNFLCTAIPYPPGCPSGEVQTVAPYWDWGSNSWQGLQCTNPVSAASQMAACQAAMPSVPEFGSNGGVSTYTVIASSAWAGAYGSAETIQDVTMTGANSINNIWNPMINSMNALAPYVSCWGDTVTPFGSRPSSNDGNTYDIPYFQIFGQDPYGNTDVAFGEACWLTHGTNNVVFAGGAAMYRNPGSCH